jgi:hypothetical protein
MDSSEQVSGALHNGVPIVPIAMPGCRGHIILRTGPGLIIRYRRVQNEIAAHH